MKKILFIGLLFVLAGTGVWSQEVSDSVRIHYRRGYRGVDPDYHNNRSELERFIRTLRREQESARLERVVICSWTSPDGVTRYNELLAGRRADSLKSWACAPRTDSRGAGERSRRRHRLGRTTAVGGSIRYAL